MAFSQSVKAAAMAACGRHCCICHKFCGTKIESHHIVHESAGGDDTFENCIPVCFDCHADMTSYDHKHPRGTKYSEGELREHRDRWYAKNAAGGGLAPSPEHVGVDKKVFAAFQQLVPYYPALDYLKDRNFAGFSFNREPMDALFRYAHYSDKVEYEFLDPEMEAARGAFAAACRGFANVLAQNSWPTHLPDTYSVPEEWEHTQPERFDRVVTQIHDAANAVETTYKDLVRAARKRLGVAGVIEPDTHEA